MVPESDLELTPTRDLTVGITTFLSHCVFWDEVQGTWDNSGCQVRRGHKEEDTASLVGCVQLIWGPLSVPLVAVLHPSTVSLHVLFPRPGMPLLPQYG